MKITKKQLRQLIKEEVENAEIDRVVDDALKALGRDSNSVVGKAMASTIKIKMHSSPELFKQLVVASAKGREAVIKFMKTMGKGMLQESQENLPKKNQRSLTRAAGLLKPDGRFSATVASEEGNSVKVTVDDSTSVSREHKDGLSKAFRTDAILGFKSGALDKSKTYKYTAAYSG